MNGTFIIRVVLYTCVSSLSGVLCTTDNAPSSSKNPNQASISYPDTVTYTCAAGYKLSDGSSSVIRYCQTDGSLSGTTPACSGKFDLFTDTLRLTYSGCDIPKLLTMLLVAPHLALRFNFRGRVSTVSPSESIM